MDEVVKRLMANGKKTTLFEASSEEEDYISKYNADDLDDEETEEERMERLVPEDEESESEEYSEEGSEFEDAGGDPESTYHSEGAGGYHPGGGSASHSQSEVSFEPPEKPTDSSYVNPLENDYAVKYTLGDEVALSYANGTKSNLVGVVEGYDSEGFYRVKWSDGLTTNGITDIALADFIQQKRSDESKCVCGHDHFVEEGKYVVCDNCGRRLNENSLSHLSKLDKSRPKGKRLIRSIPHPMSTANKPDIPGTITEADDLSNLNLVYWSNHEDMVHEVRGMGFDVIICNEDYMVLNLSETSEAYIPIISTNSTVSLDISKVKIVDTSEEF